MAFLPQGSVPYQQYLYNETPSLASHLSGLGYLTRAVHPYYASGWDRETVYPLLGFEQADFIDSFPSGGRLRKYYHITEDGLKRIEEFKVEWNEILAIYQFVTKEENE